MADHDPSHAEDDEHAHLGVRKFATVFAALCVLTALSYLIANSPLMDTPLIGWTGMITVSCAKALLVMLFFMHLLWEANWKFVLTIPASMMSIFLMLMLTPDVGLRTQQYAEERWQHAAKPQAAVAHGDEDHAADHDGGHADDHDGHGHDHD